MVINQDSKVRRGAGENDASSRIVVPKRDLNLANVIVDLDAAGAGWKSLDCSKGAQQRSSHHHTFLHI